ncbi:N/A [soil metagenome]
MKYKIIILLILAFSLAIVATSQSLKKDGAENIDGSLEKKLKEITKNFKGEVGIYVRHLKSGKTAAIAAESIFPTASMIKIPIMIGLFDKIEKGVLDHNKEYMYRDSLLYPGEDILGSFKDSALIHLNKVVMLMLTASDNTASLWCQHLAGTGTAINEILEKNNFTYTRVNSRTPGRAEIWKKYGWGQTTPREMAELLVKIYEGKLVSPAASERMYRNLTRSLWDAEAISQIPPSVQVASKQGSVDHSRSEVALVHAPSGAYVFCIITKNQKDQSTLPENEGYELIRKVSKTLWQHFEPDSEWEPAPGVEKWN